MPKPVILVRMPAGRANFQAVNLGAALLDN